MKIENLKNKVKQILKSFRFKTIFIGWCFLIPQINLNLHPNFDPPHKYYKITPKYTYAARSQ